MFSIYCATLEPNGFWGNLPKGDTLFGLLCWQIVYQKSEDELTKLLKNYDQTPFLIVSSPLFEYNQQLFLKKPDLPLHFFPLDQDQDRKEIKKKTYILLKPGGLNIGNESNSLQFAEDLLANDLSNKKLTFFSSFASHHNTINRFILTTKEETAAPFVFKNIVFRPGVKLIYLFAIRQDISAEQFQSILKNLAQQGIGRDTSTGLGRFKLISFQPFNLQKYSCSDANAAYFFSPAVVDQTEFKKLYFRPFVRFGRHGGKFIYQNPFKNPIIMADEGAVAIFKPGQFPQLNFCGKGLTGISLVCPAAVHQGYTLLLPIKIQGVNNETAGH